jgi:hypothetical protein
MRWNNAIPKPLTLKAHYPVITPCAPMDNFANASFHPDLIKAMQYALDGAISTLPHPVNSSHLKSIAEAILRSANEGECDPIVLQRLALMELQISSRK